MEVKTRQNLRFTTTGMDYRNGHYAMTLGALNVF